MLNGYILTSLFLAFTFVVLGLVVLINNPRDRTSRIYFAFSIFISLWLLTNYLGSTSSVDETVSLYANRVLFVFAGLSALSMLAFAFSLTRRSFTPVIYVFFSAGVTCALLGFTSVVVEGVYLSNNTYAITFGPLANLYFAIIVYSLAWAVWRLVTVRKKLASAEKIATNTILKGMAVAFVGIIAINVLLPVLFKVYSLTSVGSFFSAFIVFSMAYAIIKHKLFDIRLIVTRAVAYGLLIASLAGMYAITVFGLANRFLDTESLLVQQIIPIATAIFLVFTAPFFKRLFDKITNKLFYQDAYDPQTLLDDLNKVLLGNIELPILLRHATAVIRDGLRSQFCAVVVNTEGTDQARIIGTEDPGFSQSDMSILRHDLAQHETKVVVAEDTTVHNTRLNRLLKARNIALAVRLDANYRTGENSLAYLLLGPKRSGNIYNKQDLRIIEIIADEMVLAIQNALRFEEIQGFAATLQERINEATAKLKRTNEKLKEMDETKDEFISMASHQLRTPLTSVKGYLSMVLEGDAGKVSANQQKLLDQAFISSQRMVYLIADLLNVSRLKTGKFIINAAPANLAEIVEGELKQLTEVAKGKKIKVTYKKPKDFPLLMIDETKIRQVIMNFVDNAIYYTPSGGRVTLEVKEDKTNVYFTVKDNGLGIPREEQKQLFTKFYRASNARQIRPDGTGLGLFMAKKVVAAQGGIILFESTEGKGSTFGFSFSKSKLKTSDS